MTNSVRESSDSRDGSLCESSLNNSPAERRERIALLIEEHIVVVTYKDGSYDLNNTLDAADAILSSDLVGMDQQRACIEGSLTPENVPLSDPS